MKKILLATSLGLHAFVSYAQTEKLEGIGKFKIGKTTLAIIPELETELSTKTKRALTYSDVNAEKDRTAILELIPDSISSFKGPVYASQCKDVKVYLLPKYTVAGIELTQVRLRFYNGKLIDFSCDEAGKLADALTVKYGPAHSDYKERPIPCTLRNTGVSITRTGQTATKSWGSESLPAKYVVSKYYDNNCEEKYLSFFSIYDSSAVRKIAACEKEVAARIEKASSEEKRKKLGDL
jgi:hypothetical protein